MKVIDFIVIGLIIISIILGIVFGISKRLKKSFGVLSWILSLITALTILSFVLSFAGIKDLLTNITSTMLEKDNWFLTFLVRIRIEIIVLLFIIFVIIILIKFVLCKSIANILECDNKISKIFNKSLGVIYMLVVVSVMFLIVLEIIYLSNGLDGWAFNSFKGSILKIDYLYENNPIVGIFRYFKNSYDKVVSILRAY